MLPYISSNGIYKGKVSLVQATPPDVGFYAPEGAIIASSEPPTDEPGRWIWKNESWHELSTTDLVQIFTQKIQERLDDFARSEGKAYDNMLSACTYATDPNPIFAQEGQYCVEARSNTWATAYQIMNDSLTGQRPIPSWEEIEAELPDLAWPNPIEENTNA